MIKSNIFDMFSLTLGVILGSTVPATAGLTVTVTPSIAPEQYLSPSYQGFQDNALNALMSGASSAGDPTKPTYYQGLADGATISPAQMVVSDGPFDSFTSWLGRADPGVVFGSAFDQEYGNTFRAGLSIVGDGTTKFAIKDLSFTQSSSDPNNILGFHAPSGSFTYGYNGPTIYVGVKYGLNGAPDSLVTSGPSSQQVDALYSIGEGVGFDASFYTGTDQQRLDAAIAGIPNMTVTSSYSILGSDGETYSGSADVIVSSVPEPATLIGAGTAALLALGLAWMRGRSARRRSRA